MTDRRRRPSARTRSVCGAVPSAAAEAGTATGESGSRASGLSRRELTGKGAPGPRARSCSILLLPYLLFGCLVLREKVSSL